MPYKINQISPRRYEVINSKTGTIHSKSTTKKKAEAQLRLLENLEKKEMKPQKRISKATGIIETGVALLKGRTTYSSRIQTILKNYGNMKIVGATIKRSPVPKLLTTALGALSNEFAKRLKESPYDKLFHLYLVIQLENGKSLVIEKNETLSISEKITKRKEEEQVQVSVPPNLTLSTLLENTKEKMGSHDFFGYSAKNNNCQDFMIALLKANNMGNEEVFKFVKQDTAYLFNNLSYLRKISNTLTDIAGRANILLEGAGAGSSKVVPVETRVGTIPEEIGLSKALTLQTRFYNMVKLLPMYSNPNSPNFRIGFPLAEIQSQLVELTQQINEIIKNLSQLDKLTFYIEKEKMLQKILNYFEEKGFTDYIKKIKEELEMVQNEITPPNKIMKSLEISGEDKRLENLAPVPDARGLGIKSKFQKGSPEALEWCKKMREAKTKK